MITVYNENNQAWIDLFTRAWNDLYPNGNSAKPNQTRFLTLDEYFANIKQLTQKNRAYILLPIDEDPFEINANTRAIAVPANFAKCAGVVGDNVCEILTFVIDRYFDYKDLASDEIEISAHWKHSTGPEGISKICFKDIEYKYGKIRFGWPLTSEVACASGTVQFSIEFSKKEEQEIKNEKGEVTGKEIRKIYVLNTLPATIPIKAGLTIDGENAIIETDSFDTIIKGLTNSLNLQQEVPTPPYFVSEYGGQNLPNKEFLILEGNDKNTATIKALAVSSQGFPIVYSWIYKERDNGAEHLLTGRETVAENGEEIDYNGTEGDSKVFTLENYYLKTIDTKPKAIKTYYVGDEKTPTSGSKIKKFDESTDYYELGTSLKINDTTAKIVGSYYVKAQGENLYDENVIVHLINDDPDSDLALINAAVEDSNIIPTIGKLAVISSRGGEHTIYIYKEGGWTLAEDSDNIKLQTNKSSLIESNHCYFEAPPEIQITRNLGDYYFLSEEGSNLLNIDSNLGEKAKYVWYATTDKPDGNISNVKTNDNSDKRELLVTEPGWYQAEAEISQNRYNDRERSKICKVVYEPKAPTGITYTLTPLKYKAGEGLVQDESLDVFENVTEVEVVSKTRYKVEVTYTGLNNNELESEEIIYQWYNQKDSEAGKLLTEKDKGDNTILDGTSPLNENYIIINPVPSGEAQALALECKVINKIGNKVSEPTNQSLFIKDAEE